MQPTTDLPALAREHDSRLDRDNGRPPSGPGAANLALVPERLYKIARAGVHRTLGHGFTGSESEDLVQEVLERVLRSLREGRFAGDCSLSTWVTAIAQRVARDELRAVVRNGRATVSSAGNRVETAIDLEHQLEARRVLEQVQHVLERMPPAAARVVVLHDLVGHELAEVAALTGLSVTAAQSRLIRGRRALERQLRGRPGRRRQPAARHLDRRPDSACDESGRIPEEEPRTLALGACSFCGHIHRTNRGQAPVGSQVATCRDLRFEATRERGNS